MIADLATQADAHRSRETDVLIVGAGIAGLVLAARLRSSNVRVVILESGGREQKADTHPLNRTVQLGDAYSGALHGRFRCLGGTSTRWGGALIPFVEHDYIPRPYLDLPGFPVGAGTVNPYLIEVERLFGVDENSYDEEFVHQIAAERFVPTGDLDFKTRFAKWPPFKNRNLAVLFKSLIERDEGLEIWINSTATSFGLNTENGQIHSITGCSDGKRSITVSAKHVVVCAGAIESTRLLLLLDRQYDQRLFAGNDALGRYFNDHISTVVARIRAKQVAKLNRMAGFRFKGSTMRSLRFELSALAQERERVGSAFAHISFKTEQDTGFDALRNFLRSLQQSGRMRPHLLLDTLRDIPYITKLGLWRIMHKQLLWPAPATYELHVVAEQLPRADNYIALSPETDCFGLPLAAIQWRVSRDDLKTFAVFKRCFSEFWIRRGLQSVGDLDWTFGVQGTSTDPTSSADVYHPGGSTRMGSDPHAAVVDSNLRSFAVTNLWVASTSVFPSGGGENPTLTLMLFTMRLADHLCSRLRVQ